MLFASLVAAVSLSMASSEPSPAAVNPVVRIAQGALAGRTEAGITAFKGIPYAAPPVGPLRWRAPQPAAGWPGTRDAATVGPICIQPPSGGDPGVGPLPMNEDCLTLNVWAAEDREGPLPVMVWIHGGGLNNGSGTAALYDGAALARRGVVVVTINYRLGRLGFFGHPALNAEAGGEALVGNYGLADIVASLAWVRDNIAAFGGDPGNVTVFGESAGGAAVLRLMIAEPARGLFHRAVVQSGLGREQGTLTVRDQPGRPSLEARGAAFAASLGLADATVEQLRAVPAEAFLTPAPSFYGGDLLIIDGDAGGGLIDADVEPAFAAGLQAPVPLIIGSNSAEFWWMKPSDLSPYGEIDDALTPDERADFLTAYGGEDGYNAHVVSDLAFNEPARQLARLHARAGYPTFLYRFDVVSAAMPEPHGGATHASERPYVFDNLSASSWAVEDRDQRAATAMADYWTTFAKAGDPNGSGRPVWPEFGDSPDQLLEFTNDGPQAKPVPFAARLDLISAYYDRMNRP
ncbi:carboxylesterase family protein [uncultured Brevundimonas sp.]|uniref:carboxylesterase/lipase family protein n=1 Tax=uncultured Brevundimonas sp. TaxID=213418 RepID=UPI0030ED94C3|tara:strand:- start:42620 stop:44173 length:1554 start_codon:yes stop_codon:yes gene_type:complete